jgi:hypothetical protein
MAKIIKALEKSGMKIWSTEKGYPESPTELNIIHNRINTKDINKPETFLKDCRSEREQLEKDLDQKTNDFLTKIQLHRKLINKLQGVEEFARKKNVMLQELAIINDEEKKLKAQLVHKGKKRELLTEKLQVARNQLKKYVAEKEQLQKLF